VWTLVALTVIVLALGGSAAALTSGVGATERVDVDSAGGQASDGAAGDSISGDGRLVSFISPASTLVPGDTNNFYDVFVHDRQTGATERVSVDSAGRQANANSGLNSLSADGRFVVFNSRASNLVSGDTNRSEDVFVHDRQTGVTERVSVDSSGAQANGESFIAGISENFFDRRSISANGRFVTFTSLASNLVPGDTNFTYDVFVHDRQTGTTERASVATSGGQANGQGDAAVISGDGRVVAFGSIASNLVPGDTNNSYDVFVHDRQTGATERVSVDTSGGQGNAFSYLPAISGDGRFVAFQSLASNLVPGDTNNVYDVFVHDRQTGATERVSVDSLGGQGDAESAVSGISADGRFVAFYSGASNLVPGDTNHARDVFVHGLQNGTTERLSVTSSGGEANDHSDGGGISGDGRVVAFTSQASNLVSHDSNRAPDVFVHDRDQPAPTIASLSPTNGITGTTVSIRGAYLIDATRVTFNSRKAKFRVVSSNMIRATVPDRATTGKVAVTTAAGGATSASDFVVTFSIVKVSPRQGPVGTVVTLTGIGFTDVTAVKFNGVSASFTILSPTSIRATVPAGATTGKVAATSPQGTVRGPKFTVTA
jgi:IPT/TIG domain-containing protein